MPAKNRYMVTLHKTRTVGLLAGLLLVLCAAGCQSAQPTTVRPKPRQYTFWPAAPDEPRIQFLTAYSSSADLTPAQSRLDEVMYGKPQILAITKPAGVAMWQGKIYVCDVRSKGLTVLDLRSHVTKAAGIGGSIEIDRALDIAIAPDGLKYVVDGDKHAICVVDAEDHPVNRIASDNLNPISVAVYGNELYVTDATAQAIKVLDRSTGRQLRTIGEPGDGDGQFTRPLAVRVDPSGVVYVDDVIRCRVQRFSRDGKFLSTFGQNGNLPGDFVRPKHFSFDRNGYLYIVDAAFNNVQVFDTQQKVTDYFGSAGGHLGSMDLPAGVFVDESPEDLALFQEYVHPAFKAERLILVTNQLGNQRVSIYAGGGLKPGKTVADITVSRAKISLGTMGPTTNPTTQPDFVPAAPAVAPK